MPTQKKIFEISGDWIRQHWRLQLITLVVVAAFAWIGIWLPYSQLRNNARTGLVQSSLAARQTHNFVSALTNLPKPTTIEPGIFGSTARYAQAVQAQVDANKPAAVRATSHIFAMWPYPSADIRQKITQANTISDADRPVVKGLNDILPKVHDTFKYHAAVSKALANILQYIPQTDFSRFDATSADTKKRLQIAREGLIKTREALTAAGTNYQDPSLAELQRIIQQLETARTDLAVSGDTAAWTQEIQIAQARIIQNRTAFWNLQSHRHLEELTPAGDRFDQSATAWRHLGRNLGL